VIAYQNMAIFFQAQLDFIFFFYGLAFILLGTVCFAISKAPGGRIRWGILGTFAVLHGIGEWLDLTALVIGDTPVFAAIRVSVITISFILLMEFARLNASEFNLPAPGRWIYWPLLGLVVFVASTGSVHAAGVVGRYSFGFLGAVGTGVIFVADARRSSGGARTLAALAAICFFLYGIAAGIIVREEPFWPASVLHHAWFMASTGIPIQLVRALLACALAFSIWAIWGKMLATELASERYDSYLRRQFISTVAAITTILLVGWTLTEFLGGIYRHNVERIALGDIDLLASRLAGETAIVDGMVMTLARTPGLLPLVGGTPRSDETSVQAALQLHVEASAATSGYIVDPLEQIIAASAGSAEGRTSPLPRRLQPSYVAAMAGKPGRDFAVDSEGSARSYMSSMPIPSDQGKVAGVAILSKSLDGLEDDLTRFGRPYFFVDPDGRVVLTNRRDMLFKQLWPRADGDQKSPGNRPMMATELTEAEWTTFDGKREFVRRRFAENSRWSLVVAMPTETIFASRLIGIIVTLLITIMALIYFIGREHGIRESVQTDSRRALQKLAQDLRFQAITDPLTGLFNRWKFDDSLIGEMARARRYGTPLSLVLYDVDHFKQVNDIYGHKAGDDVLVRLSQVVSEGIRKSDLLARWGGEEFVILAPGSAGPQTYQAALKLAKGIAQVRFDVGKVTCSFGVAEYVEGDTAESLMARADGALYLAKINGRNRVEIATLPNASSAVSVA
jgi:diguanylate cyclase (GGDEF)-like protein